MSLLVPLWTRGPAGDARRRLLMWNGPLVGGMGLLIALAIGAALVLLPPGEAAVLLGLAALAAAALVEPLAGVVGGIFVGLLRAYLQAEIPQIPAQLGHLFIALAAFAWVSRGLLHRRLELRRVPLLLPLLGFVAAGALSLWDAPALASYGITELFKWAEIALVLLLVAERTTDRRLTWAVSALLLIGLFQAALGIYQFGLRGDGPPHFAISGGDFYRAYGTFEQPNPYGGYLGITLALGAGLLANALRERLADRHSDLSRRQTVFVATAAVLMLAALGCSWSRGAWLGFAAAAVVMAVALPRRAGWGLLLVVLLVGLAVSLYAAGLLPAPVVARLTDFAAGLRLEDVRGVGINDANYAVIERLAHWQTALGMWRANFWRGVGLGCYEAAYPDFALINWPIALGHAHNIYLNLLAETGVIGLLAYLLLWGSVFWQTWRITRRRSGWERGVAIGLLGAWTHLTVHNLFDNLYVNNIHLLVGALLGLTAGIEGRRE